MTSYLTFIPSVKNAEVEHFTSSQEEINKFSKVRRVSVSMISTHPINEGLSDLIQPLVSVHGHLRSQRLGQNQDVTWDGAVGPGKQYSCEGTKVDSLQPGRGNTGTDVLKWMEQRHQWAGTSPPGGVEGAVRSVNVNEQLLTHMMNSLGWQTTEATPPIIIQGLTTVWPPVTDVPPSSAASRKPRIIRGITRSRSCDTHT